MLVNLDFKEIITYIIFFLVFYLVIKYIKKNNETIQILASRVKKTDKQIKQEEEFEKIKKESDKKEKNKIRY
jgi:amino acid permease